MCSYLDQLFSLRGRSWSSPAAVPASAAFGPPDILVNCAGLNLRPPLAQLSAASDYLTGQMIRVDGGFSAT